MMISDVVHFERQDWPNWIKLIPTMPESYDEWLYRGGAEKSVLESDELYPHRITLRSDEFKRWAARHGKVPNASCFPNFAMQQLVTSRANRRKQIGVALVRQAKRAAARQRVANPTPG